MMAKDVPGRRDQLLGRRVVDGLRLRDVTADVEGERAFVACVMPTAPGVTETTLASEPEPTTHMIDSNVTGMAKAARKMAITISLHVHERSEGRKTRAK